MTPPSVLTADSGLALSSFPTASVTLSAANFYVAYIERSGAGAGASHHAAITGWTELAWDSTNFDRDNIAITVLGRAGNGVTAALSIDFGELTGAANWHIIEVPDVDLTGTVVQAVSGHGNATAPTVTIPNPFGSGSNIVLFGAAAWSFSDIGTPTAYTLLSNSIGVGGAFFAQHSSFKVGQDLTPTASTTPGDDWAAFALELKAAAASSVKTINGVAIASVKTESGLALASVKTRNGLA